MHLMGFGVSGVTDIGESKVGNAHLCPAESLYNALCPGGLFEKRGPCSFSVSDKDA